MNTYHGALVGQHAQQELVAVHVVGLVHQESSVLLGHVAQQVHGVRQVAQGHDFTADEVVQLARRVRVQETLAWRRGNERQI